MLLLVCTYVRVQRGKKEVESPLQCNTAHKQKKSGPREETGGPWNRRPALLPKVQPRFTSSQGQAVRPDHLSPRKSGNKALLKKRHMKKRIGSVEWKDMDKRRIHPPNALHAHDAVSAADRPVDGDDDVNGLLDSGTVDTECSAKFPCQLQDQGQGQVWLDTHIRRGRSLLRQNAAREKPSAKRLAVAPNRAATHTEARLEG